MKTLEWSHRAVIFGRMAMQLGLFCLAANGVSAATTPATSRITPDSGLAGSTRSIPKAGGSDFGEALGASAPNWNGSTWPTTSDSSGPLTSAIPASDLAVAGTARITGTNAELTSGSDKASDKLTITTTSLPDSLVNADYLVGLFATGGTPPYTWTIKSGSLPPGLSLSSNGTLSGKPTSSGSFKFGVRVREAEPGAGNDSKEFTLTVNNPVPTISGISPNSAFAGGPTFTLTVNGSNFVSSATVRWNGSDRATTFSSATKLTASIPMSDITATGAATVTVNNPRPGGGASNTLSFAISAPLTITTVATLPDGLLNSVYSQSLSASGGTPPYTWDITSGSLPPGLSLAASNGTLSGILTSSGTFSFTARVRDSTQPTAGSKTKAFTLTVSNLVPSISGINPSSANAGDPGFALTVNGSNFVSGATVRWNGSDRPTTSNSATKLTASIPASDIVSVGTASITVSNPSPGGGSSNALSFTISPPPAPPPLTITSSSPLPDGVISVAYSQTLSASGGTPPYQWSVGSGSLPPGLSLTPGTGVLSGAPSSAGDFQFMLQVRDSTQPTPTTATETLRLRINNPVPAITSLNPSSANAGGNGFTLTINGSNFTRDSIVNWNGASRSTSFISSTRLSSSISAGDIAVAGTATVAVLNPSPGGGTSNRLTFSISRVVTSLTITSSSSLPDGSVGSAYSQTLTASGGIPPYTWSILAGSLPTGFTLSSSAGTIGGTTSVSGTFNFSVRVHDSLSVAADKSFQLLIKPSLPAISISGPADPLAPAQQPIIEISLSETYPSLLSGQMTLTFTPDADVPSDDPAIQFSTGGRAVDFTIPANAAKAVFPNSTTSVAFQSGTVAGTIKMSIAMQSEGNDVTPSPMPTRTFTVTRIAPVISRLSIASRTTSGFDVEMVGFSTPRSLTQVVFSFAARAGSNLGTSTAIVQLGSSSATWFQSDTSKQFGSLFRLVIPFAVQGDVNAIQSVSATLANAEGTSSAASTTP